MSIQVSTYGQALPPEFRRDPVCGMDVDKDNARWTADHAGLSYYFCSRSCKERFEGQPEQFISGQRLASVGTEGNEQPATQYTCPMHPEIIQETPGICPICGMALDPVHPLQAGEDNLELHDMSKRFWTSLFFSLPALVLAMVDMLPSKPISGIFGHSVFNYVQLVLVSPVILWSARPIFHRAWVSVKYRVANMFTLIALGTGIAYLYSLVATLSPQLLPTALLGHGGVADVYFETAAVIITLVLLGQMLELRARNQASDAIRSLLNLAPKTARRLTADGNEEDIPLSDVRTGDRLRVRPGEKVPVDGKVIEGESQIDESLMTGEPMPMGKTVGSDLIGGTINTTGSFVMEASKVGRNTVLSQIVEMVSQAQRSKAPIQRMSDQVSAWFVPLVIAIAFGTAVAWSIFGPAPALAFALVNAIAVLIIACPCALGLATPMSILVAAGKGATAGVLVKDAAALEALEKVNLLLVDKTGTLTEGKPTVVSIRSFADKSDSELLRTAAILEKSSEHPIATAIVKAATANGDTLPDAQNFRSLTGQGVSAEVDGKEYLIGNSKLLTEAGIELRQYEDTIKELRLDGQTVVYLAERGQLIGTIGIADPIKATSTQAIDELRKDGIRVVIVTGDNEITANAVARRLGIDANDVRADVLPQDKGKIVDEFKAKGATVAMAGDGINDSVALSKADVGIAMGHGTDIAMQSSGITLVKGDLRGILRAKKLSETTMRNIRQNLFFAFGYNVVGIFVATGILYPWFGLLLNPMVAAAAMSLSSLSVVANSLRLRGFKFV